MNSEFIERYVKCHTAITDKHGTGKPKESIRGTLPCPACKTGTLAYSISNYNGHIHARCSTPDCASWGMSKWYWSENDETFNGSGCDAPEDAALEAFEENDELSSVAVGENRDPSEWMTPHSIGSRVYEWLSEDLGEEVGEAAECFYLNGAEQDDLGATILAWVKAHGGFRCFGVRNIRYIKREDQEVGE